MRYFSDTWVDFKVYSQDLNLSSNTVLRSVEVQIPSDGDGDIQTFTQRMERLLSTITSPVFSEIVISLAPWSIHRVRPLEPALRELYRTKRFKVAFCLEVSSWVEVEEGQHRLTLEMETAVGIGLYNFLPCPPLIFSRVVVYHDCPWPQRR